MNSENLFAGGVLGTSTRAAAEWGPGPGGRGAPTAGGKGEGQAAGGAGKGEGQAAGGAGKGRGMGKQREGQVGEPGD